MWVKGLPYITVRQQILISNHNRTMFNNKDATKQLFQLFRKVELECQTFYVTEITHKKSNTDVHVA